MSQYVVLDPVITAFRAISPQRGQIAVLGWFMGLTLLKLLLAASTGGTADILHMRLAAEALLAGQDIFDPANMAGAPSFFPLGHYLLATGSLLLATITGLPFSFLVKVPAILADLLIAVVLQRIPRAGIRAAIWYLASPVTILLSAYHGQFHTVALAGAVLALWLAEQGKWASSGLVLGLGASVRQHFAVLLAPVLSRARSARRELLISFALTFVSLNAWLLWSAHPDRVLSPTWTYGSWGYSMFLLQGPRILHLLGLGNLGVLIGDLNRFLEHGTVVCWVWAAYFAVWAWRRGPALDLWKAATIFSLGLYTVTPGFGIQWLLWALPFWLVVNVRRAVVYGLLVSGFVMGSYWQWQLNAKYGIRAITAHMDLLSIADFTGLIAVGVLGVVTWAYCAGSTWQLMRRRS